MWRHATSRAFVRWTVRHGALLWTIVLLLSIPATARMVGLYAHLKSDLDALLPPNAPSVAAIHELRQRMPGLQYLGVVVDVGDAKNLPAGERMLDELAARIRTYPPELVRSVRTTVREERAFVEKHAPLYLELADLISIRERIEARKEWEEARAYGADFSDEPEPSLDFSDLEAKYSAKDESAGRFPNGRLSSAEQHTTLLLVEVGGFETGTAKSQELLDRVKADLAALGGPAAYAPGMRVGFSGDVAINVEEMSALVTDLTISSLLVIVAVMAVIITYYRWWRSIPILFAPLMVATILTFGCVTLPPFSIHELNSNTAFLGSIIVGNGINFGIVLLARHVEERARGRSVEDSLVTAVSATRAGTLPAALAASVAYGSLIITDFRGFRQFGVIGGLGMLVCWVAAFVLMPSLVTLLDRGRGSAPERPVGRRRLMGRVATLVSRAPRTTVTLAACLTIVACTQLPRLGRSRLELDFSRLRRADTFVSGEGYWGRRMDDLLGRYLSPTVVLTDSPQEARKVAAQLAVAAKHPPLAEVTSSIVQASDVLPEDQDAKLAELAKIRGIVTPHLLSRLSDERRAKLEKLLGDETLGLITLRDLPPVFTTGMRERDGTIDKVVLLYPKASNALWEGDSLVALARVERRAVELPGAPRQPRLVGSLLLSADIISAIEKDGPRATMFAFLGVASVVVALFRRTSSTLLVLGSLCLGVVWLLGFILIGNVKINFANFIAFPITFGIGVDYSVNVVSRYVQDGSDDIQGAIASTGGAVGLCSLTTIIGYSSLLLAQNRALYSFGVVAVLGEIACLVVAVVVLPALLLAWRRQRPRRRAVSSSTAPHAPATTSSSITPHPEGSRRSTSPAGHGSS